MRIGIAICAISTGFLASACGFAADRKSPLQEKGQSACYTVCTVRLRGIVKFDTNNGPAGYGDTPAQDLKIKVPVLVLKKSISLNSYGPFMSVVDQKELQIDTTRDLSAMAGKCVEISGTLRGAVTATDITAALIILENVEVLGNVPAVAC